MITGLFSSPVPQKTPQSSLLPSSLPQPTPTTPPTATSWDSQGSDHLAADNANIAYIGRWGNTTLNGTVSKVIVSGGGNPFRFGFEGTRVGLDFSFTGMTYAPIIEYSLDGGPFTSLTLISGSNTIATGLTDGPHTLEVWIKGIQSRLAKRWANPLAFQGVRLDAGKNLTASGFGKTGKLLVLGDSIAEGVLTLGGDLYNSGEPMNNFGRASFINLVCEKLHWECWNHSFGGSGFYGANSGGVPTTDLNYAECAQGLGQSDPAFNAVLIEAVNNDASIADSQFRTKYEALIDNIRAHQGANIPIYCMGPFRSYAPAKKAVVEAIARDKNCTFIDPSGWSYTYFDDLYPKSDNNHPTVEGHQAIAEALEPILRGLVTP